jgi:hypothetical protein
MTSNQIRQTIIEELNNRNGILNMVPAFVARTTFFPGKRLKIAPRDLYAYGMQRGALCERFVCSVAAADNGELTMENEGLSYINIGRGREKLLLKEAVDAAGEYLVGQEYMEKHGGMTAFSKIYDFCTPIAHHVHLMERDAGIVGVAPKPEAYFYPEQLNVIDYNHAYTYFGLLPGVKKQEVADRLRDWGKYGDNGILELSCAYKLRLGTGWNVPAGILHAPGSLATYEPQRVSDTSMFLQSMVHDKSIGIDLLYKFIPEEKQGDFEYLIDMLDWEANTDPDFKGNHYCEPIMVENEDEMREKGYVEKWICYGSDEFCAKELAVLPGRSVTIRDSAAYGMLMMEGYGTINGNSIETAAMIHVGRPTSDEMYVTREAATQGVTIVNRSETDDLVMLKNFGCDNIESKAFVK